MPHPSPPLNVVTATRALRTRPGYAVASLVLMLGVSLSLWVWHGAAEDLRARADANFERYASLAFANITQTVDQQSDLALAFQALFRTGTPSRQDFAQLHRDLRLGARNLGVKAMQFSQRITEAERPAFEAAVRRDTSLVAGGYPNYAVHPAGPRADYVAVVFNEPLQGNEGAMGHDNAAEASRREVLERARDTGRAQLSAPLKLIQGHPGYIIRVPVYRLRQPVDTVEQRRAAYLGQVSGVFSASALMVPAQDAGNGEGYGLAVLDLGLSDGNAAMPTTTLLTEQALSGAAADTAHTPVVLRQHVDVGGRIWALEASRLPVRYGLSPGPLLLLGIGLTLSALLAAMVAWFGHANERAAALAERMSTEARTAARRLDAVLNNAAEGIFTLDALGQVRSANHAALAMFGLTRDNIIGQPLGALMAPFEGGSAAKRTHDLLDPDSLGMRRSQMAARADGNPFPVEVVMADADVDGERHRVATVRDLTEAKAAEDAVEMTMQELHQATEVRESMLRHAAFAIMLCGPDGTVRSFNPAAEKLLQREAVDLVGRLRFDALVLPDDLAAAANQARDRLGVEVAPGLPALVAELAAQMHVERELHLLRQDGQPVPVSLTITSLSAEAGNPGDYLLIAYDVTERRQLSAQMARLAYTDALTGLPNRLQLERELTRALGLAKRHGRFLALLFIDLDRFKPINDHHGHAMGDAVLREVGERLSRLLRSTDLCARIGGDEFVVLLSDVTQPGDGALVAEKVVRHLSEPMHLNGEVLSIGASVGIVTYPEGGDDVDTLLRQADAAMYQVKQSGRNGFRLKATA
jgi:diguanylate cyclase (GGDEF)-like protein/PAS domain S-box-containing protein